MKLIENVTLISSGGQHHIPELGITFGRRIDGSRVLRGHGIDHSDIRTLNDAKCIAEQVVDAINRTGGILVTEMEHAYTMGDCPPSRRSWECDCDRFDEAKYREE